MQKKQKCNNIDANREALVTDVKHEDAHSQTNPH
jgi:hypothetical protein